jgi:hypothetical protein
MPYAIRKLPNKNLYKVYSIDTGAIHSHATTLENARKQLRILEQYMHNEDEYANTNIKNKKTKN